MSKKELPSPELLRQLLRYEPDTGKLYWKERDISFFNTTEKRSAKHACVQWNSRLAGKEAFTADDGKGYRNGLIFKKVYSAHRIIWTMFYGAAPINQIDHINGIRSDNRISNLRAVSSKENNMNRAIRSDNSSGYTGVYFVKKTCRWVCTISANGRLVHLGSFADKNDAITARKEAEAKYGFHPNHGRR
jgi:hypothetical protein